MRQASFHNSVRCNIKTFDSYLCFIYRVCVCVSTFRLLDIEYEMTLFAFYYVGIGAAVFLLGYLQVSLSYGYT